MIKGTRRRTKSHLRAVKLIHFSMTPTLRRVVPASPIPMSKSLSSALSRNLTSGPMMRMITTPSLILLQLEASSKMTMVKIASIQLPIHSGRHSAITKRRVRRR